MITFIFDSEDYNVFIKCCTGQHYHSVNVTQMVLFQMPVLSKFHLMLVIYFPLLTPSPVETLGPNYFPIIVPEIHDGQKHNILLHCYVDGTQWLNYCQ